MSPTRRTRRWVVWGVVALAAALVLGRVAAALYVDHAWYASVGALPVWREQLVDELLLRGALFVVGTLLVFANVYAVRNSVVSLVLPRRVANLEIGEQVGATTLTAAAVLISVALGGLLAAAFDGWTQLALVRAALTFGTRDAYLDADMRFYLAWYPFEVSLYVWALLATALVGAVTAFLYALTPSLRWERGGVRVSVYVRRHFSSLGALACGLLAWSYRLDAFGSLISDGSRSFGWIDDKITIPVSFVLAIAAIAAGLTVLVGGWRGRVRAAFVAVSILLALAITGRQLVPFIARQVAGARDARWQAPYDAARAAYTRYAFAANDVAPAPPAAAAALDSLPEALGYASVWDASMLVRSVTRGRTERVIGAPVPVAGSGALLLVSGPSADSSASSGDGWAAARRASAAPDVRGAPLPVDVSGGGASEDQPLRPVRVWDAALPTLTLVDDDAPEVLTARMHGWIGRLAYAWSEQDLGLLREDPARGERVMLRRSLRDRIGAIAPFFDQGRTVTPAVVADTLYWIVHLYVGSPYYPLSDPVSLGESRWTYARHAATALVQASSGRVSIVADSQPDPLTQSWIERFPTLFARWSDVPATLRAQVPPAADGALGQAAAYAHYGTRTAPTSGRRAIDPDAGAPSGDDGHDLLALDAGTAWAIPVVTASGDVDGVLLASGGPQPRTSYLPAGEPRVRWTTVTEQLARADERAARESADTANAGAKMLLGRVRALPTRGGRIAFLRTVYRLRADGAPLVSHVSIATADSAWAVRSFAPTVAEVRRTTVPTAGLSAPALFDSTRAALRRGDWSAFGSAYESLGRALGRPR